MTQDERLDRPSKNVPTVDSAPKAVVSENRRDRRVLAGDQLSHCQFHWIYVDLLS